MRFIITIVTVLALTSFWAHATSRAWGGSTGGDWFTAGNWTPSGVPVAGDDVAVSAGSIVLSGPTAQLDSFVISATLTFANWTTALNVTDLTVQNGGKIDHVNSKTTLARP